MYKKILITILSLLCLCSNPVYAEDIIEQPTEVLTENAKITQDAPTETIDDTIDDIEDDSNIDDVTTDTTKDEVQEPKEDNDTIDESNNATDETLSNNQENINAEEENANDKIADEENIETSAVEKATITFNTNGGVLSNKTLTTMKNIGDTYGMLSGEGKHFESSKDNEVLGYANYDFGSKITISTKINFDNFDSTQEWFGNWETAGFGLGYDSYDNRIYLSVCTNGDYKVMYIPNTLDINEDHWITAVYDAPFDKMQIYIDGILQSGELSLDDENNPTKGPINVSKAPFALGCNPDIWNDGLTHLEGSQFFGNIYKAGVWTKVLSKAEIIDMVMNDYIKGDALINLDYVPIKGGYTFLGWYDEDGNKVSSNTIVTRDMTLTARWQQAYEWSVPSEIVFNNNSNTDSQKQNVSITNNNNNAKMRISLSSNNTFELINKEGIKKNFKIYKNDKELKSNDVVLTNRDEDGTTTQELNFELQPSNIEYAGDYKGQVNFVIEPYYEAEAKDIIEIEGKGYTIIEQVEGSKYKVLATDTFQHRFDASSNEYAHSEIATYLDNDYYNTLPASIKNAIVEVSIQQRVSSTGYDNGKNSPTWTGETKDAGSHKVFIPSWDEATKIYYTRDLMAYYAYKGLTWLRDTYSGNVFCVENSGSLDSENPNSGSYYIRPAMVLDLSKVTYQLNKAYGEN